MSVYIVICVARQSGTDRNRLLVLAHAQVREEDTMPRMKGADLITGYLVDSGKRWLPDTVPAISKE
jgi:hypothetical protein